jgi:hypothetical protein
MYLDPSMWQDCDTSYFGGAIIMALGRGQQLTTSFTPEEEEQIRKENEWAEE